MILYMAEYKIIKDMNLHGSQNKLHQKKTEGQDNSPLIYTKIKIQVNISIIMLEFILTFRLSDILYVFKTPFALSLSGYVI